MAFELNLTPEDVERLVRQTIMQAGFGQAISEAVKKALTGYNNPVEEGVKRYVAEVVAELLRSAYAEKIRGAVALAIQEKVTDELIDNTVAAATNRMIRAAEQSDY